MRLYKITAAAWENFYGTRDDPIDRSYTTTIAQKPDCSAFLFICKDAQDDLDGLTLLDAVPSGFDFTYCQEWGLTINAAVLARTILDIRRKAYGTLESQLDLLYHDMDADKGDKTGEWYKAVKAVKVANPK
tara:strand:+ start:58 stop:450 length:393 start_codon:yes stop_codon:yes gene_type:complete